MPPNQSDSAREMLLSIQEERTSRLESKVSDLAQHLSAHLQTAELQTRMISSQLTDLKDTMVEKVDALSEDVDALADKLAVNQEAVKNLKIKEVARTKTMAHLRKLLWLIPGAGMAELGHKLVDLWLKAKW